MLANLLEVARSTGYPVVEVPGWRTRGHGELDGVRGIVCHHTAGARTGDYPSLRVVRDGRPGLDGPLSQLGLGRSGRIYVIAAGRCWHNAPSLSPAHTNSWSIGIEAENAGDQIWPARQLDAYERLCAALCRAYGLPASAVRGHKEVQRGKPDPYAINMDTFRLRVAMIMRGAGGSPLIGADDMLGLEQDDRGERVEFLQEMLRGCGAKYREMIDAAGGVDGIYGEGTAETVLEVRRDLGSKATGGERITPAAAAQIYAAHARHWGNR